MAFSTDIPNAHGPRPNTGGAEAGALSRGAGPELPNDRPGGDRKREESGKNPPVAGFVEPPNVHAPAPGFGGKM